MVQSPGRYHNPYATRQMYSKQDVSGEYLGFSGQEPSPMKTSTAEQIQHHYQLRLKGGDGGG